MSLRVCDSGSESRHTPKFKKAHAQTHPPQTLLAGSCLRTTRSRLGLGFGFEAWVLGFEVWAVVFEVWALGFEV